jgi:hypothetical protein
MVGLRRPGLRYAQSGLSAKADTRHEVPRKDDFNRRVKSPKSPSSGIIATALSIGDDRIRGNRKGCPYGAPAPLGGDRIRCNRIRGNRKGCPYGAPAPLGGDRIRCNRIRGNRKGCPYGAPAPLGGDRIRCNRIRCNRIRGDRIGGNRKSRPYGAPAPLPLGREICDTNFHSLQEA